MRIRPMMPVAALMLFCSTLYGQTSINISNGDVAALKAAIDAANDSGEPTRLLLTGAFAFGPEDTLPAIEGDIEIAARFFDRDPLFKPAEGGGPEQLLRIAPGGRLEISDLRVKGFALSARLNHDGPLIENHGTLVIRVSRFESMRGLLGGGFCCSHARDELIGNHGDLEIARTTFLDISIDSFIGTVLVNHAGTAVLREVLIASTNPTTGIVVANSAGNLRITNSTFGSGERALYTEEGAVTEMANTVVRRMNDQIPDEGLPEGWHVRDLPEACTGPVVSLGHNLVADTSCKLNAPGDIQGVPTGTFPLSLEKQDVGLLPVINLAGASPAVDSANPAFCGQRDIRGTGRIIDGDHDGVIGCDRGAVELTQRQVTDGGINGFYFVPEEDGHYITILDNANNALVIWNTFDIEGNQAWIFGVGEIVNGRSLLATGYTNENGVLTDMGPIDIDRAIPWGTLLIELESCDRGRLVFDTERTEFVSGTFEFRRLASTRQLGCSE